MSTELALTAATIADEATSSRLPVTLWSPDGLAPAERARLLVVHDGPGVRRARVELTHYAAAQIEEGVVPPFRMAALHPVHRDLWYAANETYLAAELDRPGPAGRPGAHGGPLGHARCEPRRLTCLLLACAGGGRFGGVMAQSGSFFTPDLDPQESSYPFFDRVTEAVREVEQTAHTDRPLQVALTCGRLEENFANNDAMASALADQGHLVTFAPVADLHNYTGWRDALHPSLTRPLAHSLVDRWMRRRARWSDAMRRDQVEIACWRSSPTPLQPDHRGGHHGGTQPTPRRPAARHGGGLAARLRVADPSVSACSSTRERRTSLDTERVKIEPFNLRAATRYDVVIDRLAHWYYHPREWLKKVALMDDVYLLNSPFTFQSMEKHSAYCALMRLGMKVPDTVLVPYKNPLDNVRWAYTAERYNASFDLGKIAAEMGFPMYMKPFDGGAWRGVSRIENEYDLAASYDESGEMLMHLQKAVEPYDVFARSLTIGPETMVMNFRPDEPMHNRYAVDHGFLVRRARRRGRDDRPDGQRVLPLGVQLLRDARAGQRGAPDRLRERLP